MFLHTIISLDDVFAANNGLGVSGGSSAPTPTPTPNRGGLATQSRSGTGALNSQSGVITDISGVINRKTRVDYGG